MIVTAEAQHPSPGDATYYDVRHTRAKSRHGYVGRSYACALYPTEMNR